MSPSGALEVKYTKSDARRVLANLAGAEHKMILFVTHSVDEAVFLADKIILMSAQNRNVREILKNELSRPRDRTDHDFTQLRNEVLKMIRRR